MYMQKLNPSVRAVELLGCLSVGARALAVYRQALAMSDSLVATDIDLHLDIVEHLISKLRLELERGELGGEGHHLGLVQLVHAHLRVEPELGTHLIGSLAAHTEELEAQALADKSVSAETLAHNCGHHGEKFPNPRFHPFMPELATLTVVEYMNVHI